MSRITQQIASDISKELVKSKTKKISELQLIRSELLSKEYLRTIPTEVIQCFNKFPNYFQTKSEIQVEGNGLKYEWISFIKRLPILNNTCFSPDTNIALELVKLTNEIDILKTDTSKLKNEIYNLLLSLKTYSKVNLEFPEATPYLPKTISNSLMINISDVRNKLK